MSNNTPHSDTDGSMQCKVTYGTGAEVTVLESSLMTLAVLGKSAFLASQIDCTDFPEDRFLYVLLE